MIVLYVVKVYVNDRYKSKLKMPVPVELVVVSTPDVIRSDFICFYVILTYVSLYYINKVFVNNVIERLTSDLFFFSFL